MWAQPRLSVVTSTGAGVQPRVGLDRSMLHAPEARPRLRRPSRAPRCSRESPTPTRCPMHRHVEHDVALAPREPRPRARHRIARRRRAATRGLPDATTAPSDAPLQLQRPCRQLERSSAAPSSFVVPCHTTVVAARAWPDDLERNVRRPARGARGPRRRPIDLPRQPRRVVRRRRPRRRPPPAPRRPPRRAARGPRSPSPPSASATSSSRSKRPLTAPRRPARARARGPRRPRSTAGARGVGAQRARIDVTIARTPSASSNVHAVGASLSTSTNASPRALARTSAHAVRARVPRPHAPVGHARRRAPGTRRRCRGDDLGRETARRAPPRDPSPARGRSAP